MKVVRIDNYNRGIFSDTLIKDNLSKKEAAVLAATLNETNSNDDYYYMDMDDTYMLFEGRSY